MFAAVVGLGGTLRCGYIWGLFLRCLGLVGFAGRGFGGVLVGGALFCGCL